MSVIFVITCVGGGCSGVIGGDTIPFLTKFAYDRGDWGDWTGGSESSKTGVGQGDLAFGDCNRECCLRQGGQVDADGDW